MNAETEELVVKLISAWYYLYRGVLCWRFRFHNQNQEHGVKLSDHLAGAFASTESSTCDSKGPDVEMLESSLGVSLRPRARRSTTAARYPKSTIVEES